VPFGVARPAVDADDTHGYLRRALRVVADVVAVLRVGDGADLLGVDVRRRAALDGDDADRSVEDIAPSRARHLVVPSVVGRDRDRLLSDARAHGVLAARRLIGRIGGVIRRWRGPRDLEVTRATGAPDAHQPVPDGQLRLPVANPLAAVRNLEEVVVVVGVANAVHDHRVSVMVGVRDGAVERLRGRGCVHRRAEAELARASRHMTTLDRVADRELALPVADPLAAVADLEVVVGVVGVGRAVDRERVRDRVHCLDLALEIGRRTPCAARGEGDLGAASSQGDPVAETQRSLELREALAGAVDLEEVLTRVANRLPTVQDELVPFTIEAVDERPLRSGRP
jgi:hypothetical protein